MVKKCSKCKKDKPLESFYSHSKAKDGKSSHCKECHYEYTQKWKSLNRDRNLEIKRRSAKKWYKDNKEEAYLRKRRHIKQMPLWANRDKIRKAYRLARYYREQENLSAEVDHIIPLKGEKVCGLHVETNLQIVSREYNARKNNCWSY